MAPITSKTATAATPILRPPRMLHRQKNTMTNHEGQLFEITSQFVLRCNGMYFDETISIIVQCFASLRMKYFTITSRNLPTLATPCSTGAGKADRPNGRSGAAGIAAWRCFDQAMPGHTAAPRRLARNSTGARAAARNRMTAGCCVETTSRAATSRRRTAMTHR